MYSSFSMSDPSSAAAQASSDGVCVLFYADCEGSASVKMSDEVAKSLAAQLLASIQEREDAKARRAA